MSAHPPPVPPEQRNPHETGTEAENAQTTNARPSKLNKHLDEQARRANIEQNTRNEGYQQDR